MGYFSVGRQATNLCRIAFAASVSLSMSACTSSNPESVAPAKQSLLAPGKPRPAEKSIPYRLPDSAGLPNAVNRFGDKAKPGDTVPSGKADRQAWGTVYYVQTAASHSGDGAVSLRGPGGENLNATLSVKDFCHAAREGTVVVNDAVRPRTFNHAGWANAPLVDCSLVFPRIARDQVAKFERTVFAAVPADAPDGLGSDSRYRLVPYRTVAVDKSVFPLGTVLFIPKLKGKKTPLGIHDGYVFAADTGVGVKGPHLDFFLGRSRKNPAPDVFSGVPGARFDVQVVTDSEIVQRLRSLHLR